MHDSALDPTFAEILACPETGQPLELVENGLSRQDGARTYPVSRSVPDFTRDGRAERPGSGFERDRLAELAALEEWHFWFVGRRALVTRLLDRHASTPTQLVLDVGCGTGSIVRLLHDRGYQVVGLDTEIDGLLDAKLRHADAWLVACDATRLPFRDGTFDGALALDVLEHLEDRAALAEIRRVLKPSGWLLVSTPAMPWLWSRFDEVAGHLRRYTRRTLLTLLDDAKFVRKELVYYQFALFPLVAATRLLGRRRSEWRERERRPSRRANQVFAALTLLEVRAGHRIRWPWGSSLVAFCRKR